MKARPFVFRAGLFSHTPFAHFLGSWDRANMKALTMGACLALIGRVALLWLVRLGLRGRGRGEA